MRILACILIAITIIGQACADTQLLRIPVNANMYKFAMSAEQHCNLCEAILMSPEKREPMPLAYVRSKIFGSNKSEIQTVYFSVKANGDTRTAGWRTKEYTTDELNDTTNSFVYTYGAMQEIVRKEALLPNGTIIVAPKSAVDTSLLIRAGGSGNFIAEQVSEPKRFAENLTRLRERDYSQKVTVFDFTPRSRQALRTMGLPGGSLTWRFFSWDVYRSFAKYDRSDVFGRRTKEALLKRHEDSSGGVVILYAHSDGNDIILDTDEGIVRLTPSDINSIGERTGGRLPAIILLNCETRPILGPAFLAAGSPFVATTDLPLNLRETASFVKEFADSLFAQKQDVIDAFFSAQRKANPTRLRPIVEYLKNTSSDSS
jgi:hypothetical protein